MVQARQEWSVHTRATKSVLQGEERAPHPSSVTRAHLISLNNKNYLKKSPGPGITVESADKGLGPALRGRNAHINLRLFLCRSVPATNGKT